MSPVLPCVHFIILISLSLVLCMQLYSVFFLNQSCARWWTTCSSPVSLGSLCWRAMQWRSGAHRLSTGPTTRTPQSLFPFSDRLHRLHFVLMASNAYLFWCVMILTLWALTTTLISLFYREREVLSVILEWLLMGQFLMILNIFVKILSQQN